MDIEELRELVVDMNRINDLEARVTSLEAAAHVTRSEIITTKTGLTTTTANVNELRVTVDRLANARKAHRSNTR